MTVEANKRMYSIKQFFHIVDNAIIGIKDMNRAKKKNLISEILQNHIMLVVTEVNGCKICSYKHAKDALEMGMDEKDIQEILSGEIDHLDP